MRVPKTVNHLEIEVMTWKTSQDEEISTRKWMGRGKNRKCRFLSLLIWEGGGGQTMGTFLDSVWRTRGRRELCLAPLCGLCFTFRTLRLAQHFDIVLPFTNIMVFRGSKGSDFFLPHLEMGFTEFTEGICSFKIWNQRFFCVKIIWFFPSIPATYHSS